jgi:hypothetical protein
MPTSKKKSICWGSVPKETTHPYVEFEGTPLWSAVKKAVKDLEDNQDLTLTEWHQYIVGYICKQLAKKNSRLLSLY